MGWVGWMGFSCSHHGPPLMCGSQAQEEDEEKRLKEKVDRKAKKKMEKEEAKVD